MSVTYRKVERQIGETTQTDPTTRTEVEHQIGTEIDGVFVPFATIAGGRVEVLQRAETDRLAAEEKANGKAKSGGGGKR